MITYLSIVELKLRFTGTVLGFLWSVLEPLIQLLIMYVIFTAIRALLLRGKISFSFLLKLQLLNSNFISQKILKPKLLCIC